MKCGPWQGGVVLALFTAFALMTGGCGQQADKKGAETKKDRGAQVAEGKGSSPKEHDHSGWWCDEHGVPEAECSMCSAKVAAEFKKKGDWCVEHDRARSQCFLCNPRLKEKYAAVYRARYDKEPPEPTENEPPKTDDKKE